MGGRRKSGAEIPELLHERRDPDGGEASGERDGELCSALRVSASAKVALGCIVDALHAQVVVNIAGACSTAPGCEIVRQLQWLKRFGHVVTPCSCETVLENLTAETAKFTVLLFLGYGTLTVAVSNESPPYWSVTRSVTALPNRSPCLYAQPTSGSVLFLPFSAVG